MYYDTVSYMIKSQAKVKGNVVVDTHQEPAFHYDGPLPPIDTIKGDHCPAHDSVELDRFSSILNAVVVKGRRVRARLIENYKSNPWVSRTICLTGKDINKSYANLLLALQSKFPGLIIRYANLLISHQSGRCIYDAGEFLQRIQSRCW